MSAGCDESRRLSAGGEGRTLRGPAPHHSLGNLMETPHGALAAIRAPARRSLDATACLADFPPDAARMPGPDRSSGGLHEQANCDEVPWKRQDHRQASLQHDAQIVVARCLCGDALCDRQRFTVAVGIAFRLAGVPTGFLRYV